MKLGLIQKFECITLKTADAYW